MIVFDPGHGGPDPGAVNGEIHEDLLAARITHRANALAKYYDQTRLTREWDTKYEVGLPQRVLGVLPGDKFISIHCNGYDTPTAKGLEVFHYPGSKIGYELASRVYHNILKLSSLAGYTYVERGVQSSNFYVLRATPAQCPAILIECGFVTNQQECDWLNSERGATTIGAAIAYSLIPNIPLLGR